MIRKIVLISLFGFLVSCSEQETPTAPIQIADVVIHNGNVVTVEKDQPRAEAVAVIGDRIAAIGSNADIEKYIGEKTNVIDLAGRTLVPGFIEGHGHYTSLGGTMLEVDIKDAESFDEIIDMIAEVAKDKRPGEWIVGRGWHQEKWKVKASELVEGVPLHHKLSDATPNHPVMLVHATGHAVFANKLAMDAANITKDTIPPAGGEIVRDENGDATGMMREDAQVAIRKAHADHMAQRPQEIQDEELRQKILYAAEISLQNGITSFQDMGTFFFEIDMLKKMADAGELPIRLYMSFDEPVENMENGMLAKYRMVNYGNNFLTVRSIGEKYLDGALGTHGGWLLEPYTDMPDKSGLNVVSVDEIRRTAELAIENGYQMSIQGIGDRGVRELLNIYEEQFKKYPELDDLRWRIEHAQVVHPDDLKRFVDLGVTPAVEGIFACSDAPWVEERLGKERTKTRGYIFKTMVDAGLTPTNGTDPPVEDMSPISGFYCSTTRILPDGSRFYPEQALSREEGLYSYTLGNAYVAFEDDIKGSIKVGKLADFTVLSKDIMTIPDEEIPTTTIDMTIVGGIVKYERK